MSVFDIKLIKHIDLSTKQQCLESMANMFHDSGFVNDYDSFLGMILKRESSMSTGLGRNIGLPHARSSTISELKCAVYILDNMIDFDSIDEEGVDIVFMFAIPENSKNQYMKVLGAVSAFVALSDNRSKLKNCASDNDVLDLLKEIKL